MIQRVQSRPVSACGPMGKKRQDDPQNFWRPTGSQTIGFYMVLWSRTSRRAVYFRIWNKSSKDPNAWTLRTASLGFRRSLRLTILKDNLNPKKVPWNTLLRFTSKRQVPSPKTTFNGVRKKSLHSPQKVIFKRIESFCRLASEEKFQGGQGCDLDERG